MNQTKQEKHKNVKFTLSDDLNNITFQFKLKSIDFVVTTHSDILFIESDLIPFIQQQSFALLDYIDEIVMLNRELKYDFLYDGSSELRKRYFITAKVILTSILICLNRQLKNEQYLYIMQNQDGLIKIGISKDPESRRLTLERELSEKIHIVKILETDKAVYELELHNIFRNYNAFHKGGREWFTPYPELLKWVDTVTDKNFFKLYDKLKRKK